MNEDEFEALRRWGKALSASETSAELSAAGKAILMLADEVERLHVEIWKLRDGSRDVPSSEQPPPEEPRPETSVLAQLMRRLRAEVRRVRRG